MATPQPQYLPGDVIQLRSGGPLLTAVSTDAHGIVSVIYYNTVTGLYEKFVTDQRCVRAGIGRPEVPENADKMRLTSVVPKSSMS